MNNAVNIAQIVMALIGVVGAIAVVIAWFYHRGGQERAFTDALDRNTQANNDVAAKLEDFKTVVLDMFHQLDKRVTRLEDRS
jgi:membrane protein required for beta-lactamase induction